MTPVNTPDQASTAPSTTRRSPLQRLLAVPTTVIFVVSLVLAVGVLYLTGSLDGIVTSIRDANLLLLLVTAPIYVVSLWVLAYRWHMLVRMAGGISDLPRAAEAFLTSVIINYAAPVGLAVPSRAALTKRALGLDASQTGTIALWEIGFDVLVLGTGTALWLLLAEGSLGAVRSELAQSAGAYLMVAAVLLLLVIALAVVAKRKPDLRRKLLGMSRRILTAPSRRPAAALLSLAISVAYWAMQGLVLWMIIVALDVDVTFSFMLGFTSLPILVGMLSPIPGGAAVREGLMYVVARLSGLDTDADAILAAALIYRFALFGAIPLLFAINRAWMGMRSRSSSTRQDERMPSE